MPEAFGTLLVILGVCFAYQSGKYAERRQVWKWLRFLQSDTGLQDASPHQLAASVLAGHHYDVEED